jgi:hypothetical protein
MLCFALLVASALLLATSSSFARTWYITPDGTGDAPTIQAGVDSAAAGDTVLVACGTYYEHDIEMKSGISLRSTDEVAACVTIDAQQLGRVLIAENLTDPAHVLGLTLTGGETGSDGGGILCSSATLHLTEVIIRDNSSGVFAGGGGLACLSPSTLSITRCQFSGNAAWMGGGMAAIDSNVEIHDCVFLENSATGRGGGAFFLTTSPILVGCEFTANHAAQNGGAILLRDCPSPIIQETVLSQNIAGCCGGALYYEMFGSPGDLHVFGCTFHGNGAPTGSAVETGPGALATIENSILAFSSDGAATECFTGQSTLTILCCDVYGNTGGDWVGCIADQVDLNGNFSADPLFCNAEHGDFTIQSDSPCAPPGVTGCGLVGALPVACGPVSIDPTTWARIKERYRE